MLAQRVIITAGGTGGHLYPAQALAQQLSKQKLLLKCYSLQPGIGSSAILDRKRFLFENSCSPFFLAIPLKALEGELISSKDFRKVFGI